MKKTVALVIVFAFCFLSIGCAEMSFWIAGMFSDNYKENTEKIGEELKAYIPDLKLLVTNNIDLFLQIEELKQVDRPLRFSISPKDNGEWSFFTSTPEEPAYYESYITFEETALFTEDEKELIKTLFDVSENDVQIHSLDSGAQYDIKWDNLVSLRLLYITDKEQIKFWENYSYHWEEIAENWYACIFISRPN